jgi:mono/diheme cytochrome c family protein
MNITKWTWLTFAAFVAAIAHVAVTAQGNAGQSTWSGVYTEEQAKKGGAVYAEACAGCHGGELEGDGFAPALAGPDFLSTWNGTTVGDLFERVRVSMPPGTENSVSPQDKAHVVAFVLQRNKFPAGTTELAPQTDALKAIKFEATKPGK